MVSLCFTGLPFGRPSWLLQGLASFSNLADLMVEFGSDSFVAVVLGRRVADIVTILSCLCYNFNGQQLSSNTLSTQLPTCFNLAALYKTLNSLVYTLKIIGAETGRTRC